MHASALFLSAQGRLRSGWRAALFLTLFSVFAPVALAIVAIPSAVLPARNAGVIAVAEMPLTWVSVAVAGLAAHWVMLGVVDRRSWSYVGLAPAAARARPLSTGFALGAIAIALPCAILLAIGWLEMSRAAGAGTVVWRELALLLAVLVPAALAEELMVRGYLLSALADGMGRLAALLLTSVVFALLHANNPGMSPGALIVVGLAGMFLGAVRFATSSLYAAWAAHLAWNVVLGVVLHALVSGSEMGRAGWRTLDTGPDWATGGSWGPEGGAAAAAGLLVATWYLIGRHRAAFAGAASTGATDPARPDPASNEDGIRA